MGSGFPFVRFTVCAAVEEPSMTLPKPRLAGSAATMPLVPRPESESVCGALLSESLKFRMAVRVPVPVGANAKLAVQEAAGASEAPQVLLSTRKSPALAPLKLMLPRAIAVVLVLLRVMDFCPLRVFTATAAHDTAAGVSVVPPPVAPVPERDTDWGLLLAAFVKMSVALRAPALDG
jgi:hypothetical protein